MTPRPSILLIALLALMFTGCAATPREQLAQAERTYATAARSAAVLIRSGAIKDSATLKAIAVANDETNQTLIDANKYVKYGDTTPAAQYWAQRFADALERLAVLTRDANAH